MRQQEPEAVGELLQGEPPAEDGDLRPGQRITYRVRDYGYGDRRTATIVYLGRNPRFVKARCADSAYIQTIRVADIISVGA